MIGRLKTYLGILAVKFSFLAGSHTCFSTTMVGSRAHKSAAIRQKCRIYNSEIGRYTIVGRNTLIQNCEIGHFTAISEGCNLGLPSHPTGMVSACAVFLKGSNYLKKNFAHFEWDECPRTSIGSDVWIGAHAQIKSGLTIGDGAVVAAGAVVTHDVAPYSVVAGVPARVIRMRFDDDKIRALQNTRWWDMDDAQIQKYAHLFDNPDALISALEGEKH